MKQITLIVPIALASLLCATPVQAAEESSLGILDTINQQITNVTDFFNEQFQGFTDGFSDLLENAQADIQAAIEGSIGQMGIPDLESIKSEIEQSVGAEVNPSDLNNEVTRRTTDAIASGTFSEAGQAETLQKLQQTQASVQQVSQANQTAQSAVASQDVLKQIAAQNAQQAEILGTLSADMTSAGIKQDVANSNLANISRSIDEQRAGDENDRKNAGLSVLRTTSFAGLN